MSPCMQKFTPRPRHLLTSPPSRQKIVHLSCSQQCLLIMVRRHRRSRCWLVAFGGSLACWAASAADPLPQQVEHPFRNLAAWLREVSYVHVVLLHPCIGRVSTHGSSRYISFVKMGVCKGWELHSVVSCLSPCCVYRTHRLAETF